MAKYVFYVLLAVSISGPCFLSVKSAFSQTSQTEIVSDTVDKSQTVKGITGGRARSLAGGIVGLVSLVMGWSAKRRWKRDNGNGRNLARLALVLGLISTIFSVVHLANTAGAVYGSGSGKAGAIVALLPGSIGIILSWSVLRQKNK